MTEYLLDTAAELEYARRWASSRNPAWPDFDSLGGDCTNFISQCLYAGGAAMNYTPDTGWYLISLHDRSAAWSGVEYFFRFIVSNRSAGPFGVPVPVSEARVGDVIQLGDSGGFYHSLLTVDIKNGEPLVAAHSNDAFNRPLSSYSFGRIRCLHILGSRAFSALR
ncbi:MAG: amidase domain-containing protein [Ruminococcus sp.]|nr:amidase domain-containing protein [Ruminococcus sp.]